MCAGSPISEADCKTVSAVHEYVFHSTHYGKLDRNFWTSSTFWFWTLEFMKSAMNTNKSTKNYGGITTLNLEVSNMI